jgi:hypothetical protein
MKRLAIVVAFAVSLVALAAPLAASAKPVHHKVTPKVVKCKTGYKRVPKVIKKHGKPVVVHRCKKKKTAPKVTTPAPASTTAPAAAKSSGRIPHSHLDPTFTQNPLNPFSTTWFYSASATEEITEGNGSTHTVSAPLPEGTLSFFVNGSLECAINVGPGNESSYCDVTLKALGPQRVTTTYGSGTLSSTTTEIDNVGPLPATGGLTYAYEQFATGVSTVNGLRIGTLHIHDAVNPPTAENSNFDRYPECEMAEEPACISLRASEFAIPAPLWDAEGNTAAPVYGREGEHGPEVKIDAVTLKGTDDGGRWLPVTEIESGGHYLRYETRLSPGYTGNATSPILGGGTEQVYFSKTTLAFTPRLVTE